MKATPALLLLAACTAAPPLPKSCAVPPDGFLGWTDYPANIGGTRDIEPPHANTIAIARDGTLAWNGAVLSGFIDTSGTRIVDIYLAQVAQMQPIPMVTVAFPRGAPCAQVERVRTLMEHHLACRATRRCFQGASPIALPATGERDPET